jgi:hypothetical protein
MQLNLISPLGDVYLSQALIVHAAMIHSEIEKTNKTVPGQIVISVFITFAGLINQFLLF